MKPRKKKSRERSVRSFNVFNDSIEDAWLNNQENVTYSIRLANQFIIANYGVGDLFQAIIKKSVETHPINYEMLNELSENISHKRYEKETDYKNEIIPSKKEEVHNEEHKKQATDNNSKTTKTIQDENAHTSEKPENVTSKNDKKEKAEESSSPLLNDFFGN